MPTLTPVSQVAQPSRQRMWDEQKAVSELESPEPEVLFVCGSSRNRDRFLPYFTKIFNLRIDDDTMRRRLQERTNNDFGKQPEEARAHAQAQSERRETGRSDRCRRDPASRPGGRRSASPGKLQNRGERLDADTVVETRVRDWSVIRDLRVRTPDRAGCCRPAKRIPWTSDEFWDVLGRETITRIEYAWSGDVLATLLPYLDEQGIDLMHSDHDEVASTLSQTREGSVFVLTSDHRERYLARLDPSAFDGAVLRRYYEELNETAAEGVEYAMLDGIAFFRDTLAPLDSAIVAVLVIGECLRVRWVTQGGPMPSADEIRDAQRATWAGLSAGWEKWDSVIMDQLGPVGAAMIERLDIAEDQQHLDIAVGHG